MRGVNMKVYKCHNFRSQNVIQVDNEPVSLFAYKDKLFVATQNCCVFVFKFLANQNHQRTNAFATEARVQQLLFNDTGNYVATLEVKSSRRQTFYAVKVYLNWQLATDSNSTRSCVRLANHDHSLKPNSISKDQLQVIDIPCIKEVTCISTCQKTGNLVIVQREKTTFYQVVEKSVSNSEKTYVDVVPFLELDWSFEVKSISFCENYVAVASEEEAQVVRLLYTESNKQTEDVDILKHFPSRTRRRVSSVLSELSICSDKHQNLDSALSRGSRYGAFGSSRNSMNASPALSSSSLNKLGFDAFNKIDDDENFVTWNFDESEQKEDFDGGLFLGRRGVRKKQSKTAVLKSLHELTQRDILLADNPKHNDLRGGGHSTAGELTIVTVLYKRSSSSTDSWKFIQLHPTYLLEGERLVMRDWYREIPAQSSVFSSLVGVSCLLSSARVGTMYNLWNKTSDISHYKYTLEVHQLITDGNLLYVMNEKGLEIYSSRCNAAAIHNSEDLNGITKAYPSASLDICLLGAHPFIGATQITLADDSVVLLSKVEGSNNKNEESIWSLYALEKCSVSELFKDMLNYGSKHEKSSSTAYVHLLQEGHMIVRNALIGQKRTDDHLLELYRESCGLLGEHYSLPDAEDHKLCLPYYLMSGLSITEIVKQAVNYKQQSKKTTPYCYGIGFSYYLNYVLFQDEEPFVLLEADGDQILEVCAEVIPDRISEVILFSRLQTYNPETALKLLQSQMQHKSSIDEKHTPVSMVALASLHLKLCDPEPAHVALTSIPQRELTKICIQHHQLLHQDFAELSPLSQLMRCHCPQVLITSLVALHDTGMISLDLAIQLLQGAHEDDAKFKNNHVKEYLEKILEDNQRKYVFEEAAVLLSEIYMKRIIHVAHPTDRQRLNGQVQNKTTGYFGQRYSWLDELPPFKGLYALKQPCLYLRQSSPTTVRKNNTTAPAVSKQESCPCALCHEDLLKLQSMLCSPSCSGAVMDKVLDLLKTSPSLQGRDAIWVLCKIRSEVTETFKVMVERYPTVLLSFSTSVLEADPGLWSNFLNEVVQMNKLQAENPDENAEIYFKSFQGILKHLTDVLTVKDFLQILPEEGNMLFFLPYITECQEKDKSKKLLNTVVRKGEHLQRFV
ncbi:BLOC-2 complex member HPS3-like [Saccostrea cucullata]|uniref:BLOC-2 complex member HPS3-like n=1 Tax=Saccostrea cuccullata TaxID=36930 RepID=UPI002ED147BC